MQYLTCATSSSLGPASPRIASRRSCGQLELWKLRLAYTNNVANQQTNVMFHFMSNRPFFALISVDREGPWKFSEPTTFKHSSTSATACHLFDGGFRRESDAHRECYLELLLVSDNFHQSWPVYQTAINCIYSKSGLKMVEGEIYMQPSARNLWQHQGWICDLSSSFGEIWRNSAGY